MSEVLMKNNKGSSDLLTYTLSILLTTLIMLLFLFNSMEFLHPFIIPIYLSGIIIGMDLIDWIRGKIEVFDPVGFIGAFGFHFFFLSPLLQIYWGAGMSYVVEPTDWRTWLLGMGIINFIGLIIYRMFRESFIRRELSKNKEIKKWKINSNKLLIISIPTLLIMFALQTYIYISFGGLSGYIHTYASRDGGFEGMGFLFMLAESFPIVFIILCFHFIEKGKYKGNIPLYILLFILFIVLKLYFGGLRGSRSNTLWGIIWFAGIFHCFVKPIKKRVILLGAIGALLFVFMYGIYKGAGEQGFEVFNTSESIMEIADESGRGIDVLLLGDLSRFRTQAYILHRLIEHPENYSYAFGRSYIGDLAILIPKRLYPDRPPTKVKEGTEIIIGKGEYNPDGYVSSRIYGLTGEFMLNFGYLFSPMTFIILALFITKVRGMYFRLPNKDARLYIYPFLVVMCFLLLVQDLDNLVFGVIKNLTIPFFLLLLVREKHETKENYDATIVRI